MIEVKKKYLDISDIYSIDEITKEYVKVNVFGEKRYVYIFYVNPIIVINAEKLLNNSIASKYEEFLRNNNLDFQILTDVKKIDAKKFFENNNEKGNDLKSKILYNYKYNLENMLQESEIFVTEYYLILSNSLPVENVENYIKIFENSELKLKRVTNIQEIEKIIMKGVNIY